MAKPTRRRKSAQPPDTPRPNEPPPAFVRAVRKALRTGGPVDFPMPTPPWWEASWREQAERDRREQEERERARRTINWALRRELYGGPAPPAKPKAEAEAQAPPPGPEPFETIPAVVAIFERFEECYRQSRKGSVDKRIKVWPDLCERISKALLAECNITRHPTTIRDARLRRLNKS